jgi:glycosyltransferase involved in cell wall biosynthesis
VSQKTRPRVLLDINSLLKRQVTGVGVYTGELLRHLDSVDSDEFQLSFYYNYKRRSETAYLASRVRPDRMEEAFEHGFAYRCGLDQEYGRIMASWVDLQSWAFLTSRKWRIFHATNILMPPLPSGVKGIVTIHDLLFARFPQFQSPYAQRRWAFRVGQALQRADRIIAVSEATASDLQDYYGVASKKISVIYHGADGDSIVWMDDAERASVRRRWRLPERFLLFVGTLSAHKNVINTIKAFLKVQDVDLELVIVGKPGDSYSDVIAFLEQCPRKDKIRLCGYLERTDLEGFYQLATMFLFPSLHEGFGLPVIEAMKRRLPVLTSDNSSLRELFIDSAALVNPSDSDDIARGIKRILSDEPYRTNLVKEGERKVQTLTWKKTAEQTRQLYQSLC